MHILLFGKNGQVGWELQRALLPLGRITAVDFDSTDYCGDFSNPEGGASAEAGRDRQCRGPYRSG
jgi:dTDP-4-dehydrorhamnose reductase